MGTTSDREAHPAMSRLLAAALTVVAATALAVGAALGIVALLDATPDQPNTPLITYEHTGQER
ncbi:putative secreted protein [Streptomyces avermitilis MA-4680 = NBRC 14893]|uniref:Secreted protein n=2 Tax=Streptomyces avermitilis TaxID=33903 RepID=Q82BG6_STRAW|nr:putative secreted protein [Streptomyces avermitilis MA-4680 = NBRC 14893]